MEVSVVIPTYNRESMVGDAIESALAQTHPVHEVIVLDDGSTDGTERVVRKFGSPVRYVRQENRGVGTARNVAMNLATGDVLAFLDSDDLWYPYKIELQVAVLEKMPEVGLVYSEFDILKDGGARRPQGSRTWFSDPTDVTGFFTRATPWQPVSIKGATLPAFSVYSGSIYGPLLHAMLVLTSTTAVRRDVLAPTDRFTENVTIFEDWEFFARVARHHDAAFIDVSTAANRGHDVPGRVTSCSHLARAQCYVAMVERLWKADADFLNGHEAEVRRAEAHGLLAVAREAILSARPDLAGPALERWRRVGCRSRSGRARLYSACAVLPAGSVLLRQALRARTLARLLSGSGHGGHSVNPAA